MSSRAIKLLVPFLFSVFLAACKKEPAPADASNVTFSADTLYFDTLFTLAPSITQRITIGNPTNTTMAISQISVSNHSFFFLNVNGVEGPVVRNLSLPANDSIHLFVRANVKTTNTASALPVRDSIAVRMGNQTRFVQLRAVAQDVKRLRNLKITRDTTLAGPFPFLISGALTVDTAALLTIESGTKLFFEADGSLLVHGRLAVTGTAPGPVLFTSARRDRGYDNLPGSWPGIRFSSAAKKGMFHHVVIENAQYGLFVEASPAPARFLALENTVLRNHAHAGIFAVQSSVYATNCLILNCGENVSLHGGDYSFIHCTIASWGSPLLQHRTPVLSITNGVQQEDQEFLGKVSAHILNSIIWGGNGSVTDETDFTQTPGYGFDIRVSHTLFKGKGGVPGVLYSNVLHDDPRFDSVDVVKGYYDLRLKAASPAVDAGEKAGILGDLLGNLRDDKPDLGCYELK